VPVPVLLENPKLCLKNKIDKKWIGTSDKFCGTVIASSKGEYDTTLPVYN
jgi:hypothetical protein